MGLLDWWSRITKRAHPSMADPALFKWFRQTETAAGVDVTPETALECSPVLAGVRVLSDAVSQLPLDLYERVESESGQAGKRPAHTHPLFGLMKFEPNPEMTSAEARAMLQANAILYGNGYAEVVRDNAGNVREFWPLRSDWMKVERDGGKLWYRYATPDGRRTMLTPDRVFHLPGFMLHGLVGLALVDIGQEAIGTALAEHRHAAGIFKHGVVPGAVLEYPEALSPDAQKNLRDSFERAYGGADKAYRFMILEQGMKLNSGGVVNPQDAQLLESRQFTVSEIARVLGLSPVRLGDLTHATFSNIEQLGLEFVQYSLGSWLVRWEQRLRKDLLAPSEKDKYFFEFNTNSLIRGDIKTRYEVYSIGRQNGILSPNDCRAFENLNPLSPEQGGDTYLSPLNMAPSGQAEPDMEPSDGESQN